MGTDDFRVGMGQGFRLGFKILLGGLLVAGLLYAAFKVSSQYGALDKDAKILERSQVVLVCDDGTWIKRDPQTGSVYASKLVGGTLRFSEVYPQMLPGGLNIICSN